LTELVEDTLINHHLGQLYEKLLESNLIKIIQPYSCVEIEHVAKLIKLPLAQIETKYVMPVIIRTIVAFAQSELFMQVVANDFGS